MIDRREARDSFCAFASEASITCSRFSTVSVNGNVVDAAADDDADDDSCRRADVTVNRETFKAAMRANSSKKPLHTQQPPVHH